MNTVTHILLSISLMALHGLHATDEHTPPTESHDHRKPDHHKREPFFTNDIIRQLDCMKIGNAIIGINADTVHDMLFLIKEINKMHHGSKHPESHQIVKKYTFRTLPCAVQDLARLEMSLSEDEKEAHQEELDTLLLAARKDFLAATSMFIAQVRMFKPLVIQLIDEWCTRHERLDSHLMNWKKDEDEEKSFHKNVRSFTQLNQFMVDLKGFLVDFIHSCPKAFKAFKEKYAHNIHHE